MSKKKITSLLLSACMILSPILSPITVSAKEGDPGGGGDRLGRRFSVYQ